jgi:predicted metal-dependent hydrolase
MLRRALKKMLKGISPSRHIVRVYRRRTSLAGTKRDYDIHKESARVLVHRKLEQWNAHYRFAYKRVAIRNQKTRWGSCSTRGNLNFHYRILMLPEALQDYIIVHELCHLTHFNHSKKFWELVAEVVPDHALRRKSLHAHAICSPKKINA